ncbi:MAG: galactokinase [Candidatus Chloroheliales bacterium]|nr:MAG: galactokinase [Chloroflexota bacterium]
MTDFQELYGSAPAVVVSAPGRVNLIGEHTDYNGGFVLPTAIPQRTTVELSPRRDKAVHAVSASMGEQPAIHEYFIGMETPHHDWVDYVQGVSWALYTANHPLRGFDAWISSDVPLGSGLSSSAALEVALLRALRDAFGLKMDDVQLARLGQTAENDFVGAHVGIMDQMAASLADEHTALFLDTRSLEYQRVPLPADLDLVVLNSGIVHDHASGDYNTRRGECERACELLGVRQLRDLGVADLPRVDALPEPLNRRARHVITEDQRVLDAVAALRAGDLARLGQLFYASHASMRDDYQISVPEIDLIVELARREPDIFGARLTGGGFGGAVVMLARKGSGYTVGQRIAQEYAAQTGRNPTLLVPAQP